MRRFILVALLAALAVACGKDQSVAPTASENSTAPVNEKPLDPATSASLHSEIAALRSDIQAAEKESAQFSGGLVKALVDSRVQTLKQTLAMLEQRDKAFTFGLRLRYTVDGKPFELSARAKDELPQIEQELRDNQSKIHEQEAEVAKYSGGLVQALSLSTLATMQQTQAMLNQRRLAIKYELPQYLAFQPSESSSSAHTEAAIAPTSVTPAPQPSPYPSATSEDWEIVEVASRAGESNSSWTRFAWKLTLRNKSAISQQFDATIEFRDSDGFPVDSDNAYNLAVPALGQETFTGEALISASQVGRVSRTAAKVKKRS